MTSPARYLAGLVLLAHAARGHGALLACDKQQASAWNTENSAAPNAFTAVAIDSLRATKQALDGAGVPFFLASGTLLGWHRNCMPVPWDNDVDVGVMISDWTPGIVHSMEVAGFTHLSTVGTRSAGLTEVFEFERSGVHVRQDIHFYYTDAANDQVFTQLWEIDVSHRESWSPFALEPAEAFGLTVQVPADTELYLTEAYGDFMAKRTKSTLERDGGWNSITGPPNSGPGSLPMPAEGRRRRDASSCVTASYSDPGRWGTDPNYNARDAHCNFQVGDRSQDETDGAKCQAKGCCRFNAAYSTCRPAMPGKIWDGDSMTDKVPCNDQCKLFDPQDSFITAAKEAAAAERAGTPLCASSQAANTTVTVDLKSGRLMKGHESSEAACQGKGCCKWSMGSYTGDWAPIGTRGSAKGYCHYACEEVGSGTGFGAGAGREVLQGCKPTCAWEAAAAATKKAYAGAGCDDDAAKPGGRHSRQTGDDYDLDDEEKKMAGCAELKTMMDTAAAELDKDKKEEDRKTKEELEKSNGGAPSGAASSGLAPMAAAVATAVAAAGFLAM